MVHPGMMIDFDMAQISAKDWIEKVYGQTSQRMLYIYIDVIRFVMI